MKSLIHSALFGVAVGDALGVPFETEARSYLKKNPITQMRGFGVHAQPAGTWSDDSSLTFCLAESLCNGYDIEDTGQKFVQWYTHGYWGAHYTLFDIGGTTKHALERIRKGQSAKFSGNLFEDDNGNGSLMRIMPIVFYLKDETDLNKIIQIVREVSYITHAHFRSVFACFIYVVFSLQLVAKHSKEQSYLNTKRRINEFLKTTNFNPEEVALFDRILQEDISRFPENEIKSSGYVLDSLEASLWCLMNSNSLEETILKAVNLGGDTDSTGAIAGGLAGLLYGYENIPLEWINTLARKDDIDDLCNRLALKLNQF
ncbi:ADP-ribosylglycohydrolase family protein [Emticicia fontis]